MDKPFVIRSAKPEDISFIYSSWLKSYKHGSSIGKSVRTSIFFNNYREIVDVLLERSNILVACLPDSPDVILGYIVYESIESMHILHYAFVKESFRYLNICNFLVAEAKLPDGTNYTHHTFFLDKLNSKHLNQFVFNPFHLYERLWSAVTIGKEV